MLMIIIDVITTFNGNLNLSGCCLEHIGIVEINALYACDKSVDRHLAALHILELSADDEELTLRCFFGCVPDNGDMAIRTRKDGESHFRSVKRTCREEQKTAP